MLKTSHSRQIDGGKHLSLLSPHPPFRTLSTCQRSKNKSFSPQMHVSCNCQNKGPLAKGVCKRFMRMEGPCIGARGLSPCRVCDTRWHSDFRSVARAIVPSIQVKLMDAWIADWGFDLYW